VLLYISNFVLIFLFLFKIDKLNVSNSIIKITKSFFIIYLILFIGFRYKVGGDWEAYLYHYEVLNYDDFLMQLLAWDPAYVAVEYISKFLGFGIWGVNIICALIFSISFLYFIKVFNLKLGYSFLIAYPYLIMVVVNGYSRQGVAIGLVMVFFGLLYKNKFFKALIFLLLAALFHKTAIIAGILFLFYKKKKIFITYSLLFFISFIFYYIFQSSFVNFIKYYFEQKMQSSGAIIRILINILAAMLLFFTAKRYKKYFDDYDFWKIFGYFSFLMLFIAVYFKATTVADRLLLYFYPLQIVVFQRILFLIKDKNLKYIYFLFLILLSFSILIFWFLFATHRFAWIPYNNYLFLFLGF
jgi:hypothetical protein